MIQEYMAFAFLDSSTGELIGSMANIDVCGAKIEHGGLALNTAGDMLFVHMNVPESSRNILSAL